MKRTILAAAMLLVACDNKPWEPTNGPDQCLRREIFQQCLAALPKGPDRTGTSSDWDEVVGACENAAYYQSQRRFPHIKPECRHY
jgi:hypothetical protein